MTLPETWDRGGPERRRRRSDDTITALHYQLSFIRREAALEALVLVDDRGCLVAGAGAWPACEELAAYAPLFANPAVIGNPHLGSRLQALSADVEVEALSIDGGEVLLCGKSGSSAAAGDERRHSILRAAEGCKRILAGC